MAVPLAPGNTVNVSGSNYAADVVEDVDRTVQLFDTSNDLISTVTVRDRVTQLAGGTYNFERFLLNGPSSPLAGNASILRYDVGTTGYTGFATDVDFDPTTTDGTAGPQTVTRSADGNTVTFNDPFQPNDVLTADTQTDYLTIQTDAPSYALTGTITVTGSVGGNFVSGSTVAFAPALPEPAMLALMPGFAAIWMRRRR